MKTNILYLMLLFLCMGYYPLQSQESAAGTAYRSEQYLKDKLDSSRHFKKYINQNGVVSYILDTHIAKHQISMYYTNPSITDDGKYIWFWLTKDRDNFELALFDVEQDEIRKYKDMKITSSSSYVDPATGEVYWVKSPKDQRYKGDFYDLVKRGPLPKDKIEKVGRIPHFLDNAAPPRQVVTHLSPSADGKSFAFDSGHYPANNKSYLGIVPIDGHKPQLWTVLDRRYNHAQMHPVYNDVMLAAQDYFRDDLGQYGNKRERIAIDNRMWIIYRDGEAIPVFPKPNNIYHEWWDASGKYLWYIDKDGNRGGLGVCRVEYFYEKRSFGEPELIWYNALGHAYSSKSGKYLVGDHGYKEWEKKDATVRVSFYNIETKTEVDIASAMPFSGEQNHPHPYFAMHDKVIGYTFAEKGRNCFAITFTDQLITLSEK